MNKLLNALRAQHMAAVVYDGSADYSGSDALVPPTRIPNRSLLSAELQRQVRKRVTS